MNRRIKKKIMKRNFKEIEDLANKIPYAMIDYFNNYAKPIEDIINNFQKLSEQYYKINNEMKKNE